MTGCGYPFLTQNDGWYPIQVQSAECSNHCRFDSPPRGEQLLVPPGESREVKVIWRAPDRAEKAKDVQWELWTQTSDPRQPEIRFVLKGRIP